MGMAKKRSRTALPHDAELPPGYNEVLAGISDCSAERRSTAQAINSILTATYWEVGRRVVELEQRGQVRAAYGEGLWKRLADDLTARHGRGFSKSNIALMRAFYLQWDIFQTPSGKLVAQAKASPFSQLPDRSEDERPDTQLSPSLRSHTSPEPFGSPGPTTSSSWRWTTPTPAASMKPSAAGRLVRPSAPPPDRLSVLRADGIVEEQDWHANQGPQGPPRGCHHA